MYIGRTPIVGNFVKLDAITTSATTTFNLTNGGVAYYPQSANNCLVSLNGILQAPTDSYTISGSTIVFSSALTTSDVIDFIIVLGDVLNIGTPSDNTVSLAKLTATGTKDATTFLRGDNTFASAGATAGQVIQVVSTTKTDTFGSTSDSFTDVTGLSVSITPSSSSNKILIISNFYTSVSGTSRVVLYNLVRNSTNILQPSSSGQSAGNFTGASNDLQSISMNFLDSPSSTSSVTYKIQGKGNATDFTWYVGRRSGNDWFTPSTITALEIKG